MCVSVCLSLSLSLSLSICLSLPLTSSSGGALSSLVHHLELQQPRRRVDLRRLLRREILQLLGAVEGAVALLGGEVARVRDLHAAAALGAAVRLPAHVVAAAGAEVAVGV